ncbi:MAG: type II toxin-antitoxin system HicA family toxin [Gammaproteobacteria bacterium]
MSKINKLIQRIRSQPADFEWRELVVLMRHLGFDEVQGDGSRVKYYHEDYDCMISLHKPDPSKVLKKYMIKRVVETLSRVGVL